MTTEGRVCPGDGSCTHPFCAEHSPLMKATIRFWNCPVQEHRDRRDVVTVEWRGDIACCTEPTCANTNAVTRSQTDRQPDAPLSAPTAPSPSAPSDLAASAPDRAVDVASTTNQPRSDGAG